MNNLFAQDVEIPENETEAKLKVPPPVTFEKTAFGVAVMPSLSQADVTATP